MRGIGGMGGYAGGDGAQQPQPQQQPPKKHSGIGFGDVLGAIPH
jgi:hypothetical protein